MSFSSQKNPSWHREEALSYSDHWQIKPGENLQLILSDLKHQLHQGFGFCLLKNALAEFESLRSKEQAYVEIGKQFGEPVFQDPQGSMITHIKATDESPSNAVLYAKNNKGHMARPYETNLAFCFHSDPCDIAGLACLSQAEKGGESQLASAIAVHEEIKKHSPELLKALYQPFPYLRPSKDQASFHLIPIFSAREGYIKFHAVPDLIRLSQLHPKTPKLSSKQIEALDCLEKTANQDKFHLTIKLADNDILLLNNHLVMHARSAYTDSSKHTRHLLRLWLSAPERPLAKEHRNWFGAVDPGLKRGGYIRQTPGS